MLSIHRLKGLIFHVELLKYLYRTVAHLSSKDGHYAGLKLMHRGNDARSDIFRTIHMLSTGLLLFCQFKRSTHETEIGNHNERLMESYLIEMSVRIDLTCDKSRRPRFSQ